VAELRSNHSFRSFRFSFDVSKCASSNSIAANMTLSRCYSRKDEFPVGEASVRNLLVSRAREANGESLPSESFHVSSNSLFVQMPTRRESGQMVSVVLAQKKVTVAAHLITIFALERFFT
jgi:hypothetical protein